MPTSFKRQTEDPPASFRTPSPPRQFWEPCSPASFDTARRTPPAPDYEQITPERSNGFDDQIEEQDQYRGHGHSYGNSTYTRYSSGPGHNLYHKSDLSRTTTNSRDRSIDGASQGHTSREDAELLLNFTRAARFAPITPSIALEASNQSRSVSFNSYSRKRPSLTDLQFSRTDKSREHKRPITQSGHRSIWKSEAYAQTDSRTHSANGSGIPPYKSKPLDERYVTGGSGSNGSNSNGHYGETSTSTLANKSVHRSSSTEAQQKFVRVGEAIDVLHRTPKSEEAMNHAANTILHTPLMLSMAKHSEDMPSICALCNFARNTAENEADSDMTSWISCDGCRSWFHFACAGFKSGREVRAVDKFRCKKCKPLYGPTTYVRKSSRAHTSIDYAGLNEGVIKTSDADPEHHYVKDFKNGKKFTPENFARMRPELVTARFFELGDGMREPVVIPAEFNPRPRPIPAVDSAEAEESMESYIERNPELRDNSGLDTWLADTFEFEMVRNDGQDALDMVIPQDLTVRKVCELYGPDEKLEVIDVKSQNGEDKPWTLQRWADYYESTGEKVVRNVISLEVSQSKLGRLIRRPKIVRDLDLQDSVWPNELQDKGEYPKVQFYCLMSVADCYTDFHIDFGGSSVYYHILRGKKTFFFIPPTEKHLKQYEEWCNSPAQNWTFLGDQTNQCHRVDLSEGDTMLIPAGWIHAVWTPADSLVIGGNFLTRLHYPLQIRVAQIEKATNVARKFRYPFFQKLLWYSAHRYMDEDPTPDTVSERLNSGQRFSRPDYSIGDEQAWGETSPDLDENYQARFYPRAELDGLPELCRYLLRTALIASGYLVEGITTEARNAVKRSIPKGHNHGEPFEAIKKFAVWCTWKRGNETIPYWAYPAYVPEDATAEGTEKKLSSKARRKLDHEAANNAVKDTPDRQSTRRKSQPQSLLAEMMANQTSKLNVEVEDDIGLKRKLDDTASPAVGKIKKLRTSSISRSGGGRKTACESCRKSRRACKHGQNLAQESSSDGSLLPDSQPISDHKTTESLPYGNGNTTFADSSTLSNSKDVKMENAEDLMVHETNTATERADYGNKTQTKPGGRTKACKDCRKSKRRCVHDELGNEDPRKTIQAVIPRPAAKKKKNVQPYHNGLSSPDVHDNSFVPAFSEELSPHKDSKEVKAQDNTDCSEYSNRGNKDSGYDINQLIDPALLAEEADETINLAIAQSAEQALSMLATSPHPEVNIDPQLMDISVSQVIDASLISPPDSTGNGRETSPTATMTLKNLTPPRTANGSSRHSSRAAKAVTRLTPESGTLRQPSLSSGGAVSSRDSTSPTMSLPPSTTPLKQNKSRAQSEMEADEASLKLIREMQAQDLGLRRRA